MNEPWTDENSIWRTQPAFFTWLRGSLRRMWTRYPVSSKWKSLQRRPAPPGSRAKWVGDCSVCRQTFAISNLQIDHIIPAGSIRSWDDAGQFLRRLLTTSDNMRLVCKPCHKLITKQEQFGMTLQEAQAHDLLIEFTRALPAYQKQILIGLGLDANSITNAAKRRSAYHQHLLQSHVPPGRTL